MSDDSSYRVPSLFEQAMEAWVRAIAHQETTPKEDRQWFDLDSLGFALLDVLTLVLERSPLLQDLQVTIEGPDTDESYLRLRIKGHQQQYMLTLSSVSSDEEEDDDDS